MGYILYAGNRSPGTLLDETPTKERDKESSQDPKETKFAQDITLAKESLLNHEPGCLPVCRTAICRAYLVFYIPSKAHCLKT